MARHTIAQLLQRLLQPGAAAGNAATQQSSEIVLDFLSASPVRAPPEGDPCELLGISPCRFLATTQPACRLTDMQTA